MNRLIFFLFFLGAAEPSAFASWRWDDPRPQGNALYAATLADNESAQVVAVGAYGTVLRGTSEGTWENLDPAPDTKTFTAVLPSLGGLVATGPAAGIWHSVDLGSTWTALDRDVSGRWLLPISAGALLCLGPDSCHVRSDVAFESVATPDLPRSARLAAAARNGRAVVVGAGGAVSRTDNGRDWFVQNLLGEPYLYALSAGPDGFFAAGWDSEAAVGVLFFSANGEEWTRIDAPAGFYYAVSLHAAHNGVIMQEASFDARSGPLYLFSSGQWTKLGALAFDFYPAASCVVGGFTLLFDERGLVVSLPPDGTALSVLVGSPIVSGYLYTPFFRVAASGDFCLALDLNGPPSPIFTTDGAVWQQPLPSAISGANSLLAFSGGIVAHGGTGLPCFYRTTDGADWQLLKPTGDVSNVQSFAANNDGSVVVAIARDELLLGSTYTARRTVYRAAGWDSDAPLVPLSDTAWQENQPPDFSVGEHVQWDGTRFVMLLYPGRIFTSTDGSNWSRLPALPAADVAVAIASNGDEIVVRTARLSADGTFSGAAPAGNEEYYVFSDGRWWPRRTGPAPELEQRQVIWDGAQFCALGRGEIFTSPDGWRWSSQAAPATLSSLCWSGTRLFAFTESFSVLSSGQRLEGGAPVEQSVLDPRLHRSPAAGENYELTLTRLRNDEAWQIIGLPAWVTAQPFSGTGPAKVKFTVTENTSKTPRGAVVTLAGSSHLLSQDAPAPPVPRSISSSAVTIKLPFAGSWSAQVTGAGSFSAGLAGSGTPALRIAANTSTADRQINVDLNGFNYVIEQEGRPVSQLRAGTYAGPVGYVSGTVSPDSIPPIDAYESFEGDIRFSISASPDVPGEGAYSVSMVWHDGANLLAAKGKGRVSADGKIAGFNLAGGGKTFVFRDVSVALLGDYSALVRGIMQVGSVDFVFNAGKNFHREQPLAATRTGLHTFVLDATAAGPPTAAGTWALGQDGTARFSIRLPGGAKATCSSFVWTGEDGRNWLPFTAQISAARTLVGGYFASPLPGEVPQSWSLEGFADRKGVQEPFDDANRNLLRDPSESYTDLNDNGYWDSGVFNLWARGGPYQPPAAGQTGLYGGENGADLVVSSPEANEPLITAFAQLVSGRLNFSDFDPANAKWKLTLSSKTGIVSGSFSLSGQQPISVFGVVDQDYPSGGRILGFAIKGSPATFSVTPR
ncbi:MAG: BACON domain-containing protein [Chthoniobacterales bacterium]|nr:BACON domain-containing protein [Chthoniobacterales bacterium]